MFQILNGLKSDKKGATAIEYGLIAALVAVVIIAGITLMGDSIGNTFNNVANNLNN
ncbi:MAG: Flp family type IVb pilin [Rhodospirillales bacterium]|nr:Flp family type IVb pilin [Rhodospirillales bacterium]